MAQPLPVHIVQLPPQILALPVGSWGISYDIGTNATQRDLPDGWNAPRCEQHLEFIYLWHLTIDLAATYPELIQELAGNGFVRHQYSDYRAEGVDGHHVWSVMWSLRNIRPPMKLESTVLGLKMQFYHHLNILDISNDVCIGGVGAPILRAPTPAGLVPAGVPGRFGPPVPPANIHRPTFTRQSHNANDPQNWRY